MKFVETEINEKVTKNPDGSVSWPADIADDVVSSRVDEAAGDAPPPQAPAAAGAGGGAEEQGPRPAASPPGPVTREGMFGPTWAAARAKRVANRNAMIADYLTAGYVVCPTPLGEKRPAVRGWPLETFGVNDFDPDDGVGIITGPRSAGKYGPGYALVCVDIDDDAALAPAAAKLPPTLCDGRPSRPRSHWWYVVHDVPAEADVRRSSGGLASHLGGPAKRTWRHAATGRPVIELLGTGQQATVPPSLHASGQTREWYDVREPHVIPYLDLVRLVDEVARECGAVTPPLLLPYLGGTAAGAADGCGDDAFDEIDSSVEAANWYDGPDAPELRAGASDHETVVRRCRAYVACVNSAVDKEKGSPTTWRVARVIAHDYALEGEAALEILHDYNRRCVPPWTEADLTRVLSRAREWPDAGGRPRGWRVWCPEMDEGLTGWDLPRTGVPAAPPSDPATPVNGGVPWPVLRPDAYHGVAGALVTAIEPTTEADPVAVLVQLLVAFGSAVGRGAYFRVEDTHHYANEFVCLVGATGSGRKGTSWNRVRRVIAGANPSWEGRIRTSVSSGEGVIHQVRDPLMGRPKKKNGVYEESGEEVILDPGVDDKRLLLQLPEYSILLKNAERSGNTITEVLRQAWDGDRLTTMTRNSPERATGAHVSLIGHVTADDLRGMWGSVLAANGFANRHLWVLAKRSKFLPLGGDVEPSVWRAVTAPVEWAIARGRTAGEIGFDEAAATYWCDYLYAHLERPRAGRLGDLVVRAAAHVRRLAMIYALLDDQTDVGEAHLRAALAVWEYAEASLVWLLASGGRGWRPWPTSSCASSRGPRTGVPRRSCTRRAAGMCPRRNCGPPSRSCGGRGSSGRRPVSRAGAAGRRPGGSSPGDR